MAEGWIPLPLKNPLFANVSEDAVIAYQTGIENGFITELGGHSRFPGLKPFTDLPDQGRVYLHDWNDNLIAATSRGRVYSIDPSGMVTDRTGTLVSGGRRVIFAKTNQEIQMAAGGPIVRLRSDETEILSPDAPISSHVQFLDGITIASEMNSGRFYHTPPGITDRWDPLDTFAADGNPDDINAIMVTPFRELMVGGRKSIEQFETATSGDALFFRRWSVGEGVSTPYAMIHAENANWTFNKLYEFVKISGQTAIAASTEIGLLLSKIDDWDGAWIGGFPDAPLHIKGQKFILIQIPKATNSYGSKGLTLLYDYRGKRWSELYGFDFNDGIPSRWPGWSHWQLWTRTFVGGEGKIYEVDTDGYYHSGAPSRWLIRTAHMAESNQVHVKRFRLGVKRGMGGSATASSMAVRCRRDGGAWGTWIRRSLGKAGETRPSIEFGSFGIATSFQFEISTTEDVEVELLKAEIQTEAIGH